MKNFLIAIGVALVLSLILVLTGAAQYDYWSTPQHPVPDEVNRLFVFDNTWQGEASLVLNNVTMPKFQVSHGASILPHSRGIRIDFGADIPGIGAYMAINILGYDDGEDAMHLFTIDSFGNTRDRLGSWLDDKHLYFEYHGSYNGKYMVERIPITIINDATYTIADTVSIDGKIVASMNATFNKL